MDSFYIFAGKRNKTTLIHSGERGQDLNKQP